MEICALDTITVTIPGQRFAVALTRLKNELVSLSSDEQPFPLPRLFEFIALTPANARIEKKLRDRGSFNPAGDQSYRNEGRIIDEPVQDLGPEFDHVRLYIPKVVRTLPRVENESFIVDVIDSRVLLTFAQPPAPGLGERFVLERLVAGTDNWRYTAVEDLGGPHRLDIIVDLSREALTLRPAHSDFPGWERRSSLLRSRASILDCGCCGNDDTIDVPDGPRVATLHAKIIYPHPNYTVEHLIAAMNMAFRVADLEVKLASVERVDLPEFYDVDVGRCWMGEATDEQRRLFQIVRNGVGQNEICAYWVRSIGYPTIGCAAHPRGLPSLICSQYGTQWVLAHEVGHVLGLQHVDESDTANLMRPKDAFSADPPHLNRNQVRIMRSRPLTQPK